MPLVFYKTNCLKDKNQNAHFQLFLLISAYKKNLFCIGYPPWTAWYVSRSDVRNDQWGQSHFNWSVDGVNYHVLRTGAFPFVKYHISRRPVEDLDLEDNFYRLLKVLNFGLPTLLYGIAGLLWANHTEIVNLPTGNRITIYFWYRENRGSPN